MREAFAALGEQARATDECPEPDRIWDAARGALSPADTRDLVDHVFSCAACAEAWRLATEVSSQAEPERHDVAPVAGRFGALLQRGGAIAAGLAAMAVLAIAGIYLLQPSSPPDDSVYRQVETTVIRSLIDEATPLPRERCILRWSPGPDGTTYRVRVSREDLTLVAVVDKLERTGYEVPASALFLLPSGARLLWQVEALTPAGVRTMSQTFIAVSVMWQ